MTDLVVRKIPWEFDATVPFMWQPANPNFGLFCNAFTFIAVPFERYIVSAVRKAQDRLNEDPDVAAEAEAFLRQEAQHAAAHRKHMLALVARYPELERCYEDACTAYDELIDEQPIEFHAAYIANLEATFTPLFKVILDNRDSLFSGGDERVAKTFDEVVPFDDRGASTQELMSNLLFDEFRYRVPGGRRPRGRRDGPPTLFHAVPTADLVKMMWRLMLSQTPHHDPADQPLPDWAAEWMRQYDRGTDMTTFFGAPPEDVSTAER